MRNKLDLVVVVLLNYNQNEYTCKCIESILLSNYANFKIILIDNGSSNENFQKLKSLLPVDSRLFLKRLEKNIGYGKGTNFGLAEAHKMDPSFFLIMNNDTIIDTNAITALRNRSKDFQDRARVTGKVFHYDQPELLQYIGFKYVKGNKWYKFFGCNEIDQGQYDGLKELDMMDDVFVFIPNSLYEKIGGYTTYLWMNGHNVDHSLRAIKEGYRLAFCPDAKLWHKGSVSIGGRNMNPNLVYWDIQSKLILRYLYLKKIDFLLAYFDVLNSTARTFVKAKFLKLKGIDIQSYANAKYQGILYFHRWLKLKNENDGSYPF